MLFCVSVEVSTVTVPVLTQSSDRPFRPAEFWMKFMPPAYWFCTWMVSPSMVCCRRDICACISRTVCCSLPRLSVMVSMVCVIVPT